MNLWTPSDKVWIESFHEVINCICTCFAISVDSVGLVEAMLFTYLIKALLLHLKFIIENHLYTRFCFTRDPDCTEGISCCATFQCCVCVDNFAVV